MIHCARCQTRLVRLAPRQGISERVLSLLTVYPYRCQLCGHRFLAFRGRPGFVPRRNFRRVPVHLPIKIRSAFFSQQLFALQDRTVDLTIGGCRVHGDVDLPVGARVRLELELSGDEKPVLVDEAVVASRSDAGMGLTFTKLRRDERRRLGRLIRTRLASVPPESPAMRPRLVPHS